LHHTVVIDSQSTELSIDYEWLCHIIHAEADSNEIRFEDKGPF
jgi:hypothetical protein